MLRFSAKPFGFLLLLRWPEQHEGLNTCNHYSFRRNVISRQQFGPSSKAETSKDSTLPLTINAFGIQSVAGNLVLLEQTDDHDEAGLPDLHPCTSLLFGANFEYDSNQASG